MPPQSIPVLSGIELGSVAEQYRRRDLGELSDAQLVAAAADVVAVPRRDPADSFVLHAPLELAARAALLPLVQPHARADARLRIVALTAGYESYEPIDVDSGEPDGAPRENRPGGRGARAPAEPDPIGRLLRAIGDADLHQVDVAARLVMGRYRGGDLARALAPGIVPLTAAAGHAPIFLYHLSRRDPLCGLSVSLLRPLARELARNPTWRMSWTDRWTPQGPTDAAALGKALTEMVPMGIPGSAFIHPLMMQVDRPGVADSQLGPVLGTRNAAAAREVLRVAARSMILDSPEHAAYGWSHCLTLPQALLAITEHRALSDVGLALAATTVAAFRVAMGERDVSFVDPSQLPAITPTDLATAAAASHDAHVVKYALACLDAAHADPEALRLYLGAGRHLLDVWADKGGDPNDPLR